MKRLLMLIPLAFLCCFGCQQGEKKAAVDVDADIQAIKDAVADIAVAFNTGDIDKAAFYHADEVVVIQANKPALVGKETCIHNLQQVFDQYTLQVVCVVKDVQISGDLAVAYFTYTDDVTPKSGGETIKDNGSGIYVFKKQPDGTWKFIYYTESNERLISPDETK